VPEPVGDGALCQCAKRLRVFGLSNLFSVSGFRQRRVAGAWRGLGSF
jgi:hypothetical protein